MTATSHPTRREFLRTGAVATGGLVIAFSVPGGQAARMRRAGGRRGRGAVRAQRLPPRSAATTP